MPDVNDEQLIKRYLKKDEKALEILIKRYLKQIYGFIHHYINNDSEAEDIAQEVFFRAWKNIKKFDTKKSFKTWIFTIAKNASIDFLKKKKEVSFSMLNDKKNENSLIENIQDKNPTPIETVKTSNTSEIINFAIKNLSQKYKEVIILYYIEHLNFRQISEILNESIDTVKSRHRRSIIALKELIPKSLL